MLKELKSWWNELKDVRPFVTAFVDEFNNNRGRFRVYRDGLSYLIFDKDYKVFYPVWLRDDLKLCRSQAKGCSSKDWIKKTVEESGFSIEAVEWTTFLTHREEAYLYKYCYKVRWDKYQKGVDEKLQAKNNTFNKGMLDRYSK